MNPLTTPTTVTEPLYKSPWEIPLYTCVRCHDHIPEGRWETNAVGGKIHLTVAGSSPLGRFSSGDHPLIQPENGYQCASLEWRPGQVCNRCQQELIELVNNFFRVGG